MNQEFRMEAKFWGVRGSLATPEATHLGYGGNTACLEIRLPGDRSIIFDAGTGLRALGQRLAAQAGGAREIHLFLSHFHWDHIAGVPLFAPLYQDDRCISFHASGHFGPIETILRGQMSAPYFPVDFKLSSARKEFIELDSSTVRVDEVKITHFPLNHPQGAFGFRIEANGAIIVYATDYEPDGGLFDCALCDYAQNADLLICDTQYRPEEYEQFRGRGHGTWREAVSVVRDAKAKKLILFHHDPSRTDAEMDRIVAEARTHFENTDGAREGAGFIL
jgi:phosphoribosyl 1,2-cyclic phosphodiesterase